MQGHWDSRLDAQVLYRGSFRHDWWSYCIWYFSGRAENVRGWPRSSVAKRRMRSSGVVVDAPVLDDHLSFPGVVEDLAIEQFVSELAIEGLALAVLPR